MIENLTREAVWKELGDCAELIARQARKLQAAAAGSNAALTQDDLESFAELGIHIQAILRFLGCPPAQDPELKSGVN